MHCEKMAVTDMFRQRDVIEFLVKDGNSAGVIYEGLQRPKGKAVCDCSFNMFTITLRPLPPANRERVML